MPSRKAGNDRLFQWIKRHLIGSTKDRRTKRRTWMVCSQRQPRLTSFSGSSISPVLVYTRREMSGLWWLEFKGQSYWDFIWAWCSWMRYHFMGRLSNHQSGSAELIGGLVVNVTSYSIFWHRGLNLLQKRSSRSTHTNNYLNWYLKKKRKRLVAVWLQKLATVSIWGLREDEDGNIWDNTLRGGSPRWPAAKLL